MDEKRREMAEFLQGDLGAAMQPSGADLGALKATVGWAREEGFSDEEIARMYAEEIKSLPPDYARPPKWEEIA